MKKIPYPQPINNRNEIPIVNTNISEELQSFLCPNHNCGREFEKPLIVNDLSKTPAKTFYACPYCLSEVKTSQKKKQKKYEHAPAEIKNVSTKRKKVKPRSDFNCPHYLGYLKERLKNEPVPEECLTCPKIIQCSL